ncbi:hypothetical protein GCM10017786_35620 [Amycolatopsis deserti]|uniref:Uncharacterized protein n=1 Tax=Amycolatopsis deserti TaxID=185696 RepID=A0ABQ3IZR7_9PSEU|nr:hypothetical protein [Amycolatopsis deserti]GHE99357.1 hypothetical protein GCM10017786_35620 [Amycolatopsis deserti]
MARTILRDRSDDLVRSVQLADRTGIVAASAPKPVEPYEDHEPILGEFASVSGQLNVALAPVACRPGAGDERRLLRRVRRNVLVAAAAVVLVGIGWFAGGAFGSGHDSDTAPAVAVGVVPSAGPVEPVQPPPSTSPVPQVPPATMQPSAPPQLSKTSPPAQKKVSPTRNSPSGNGEARNEPVEETGKENKPLGRAIDEQIQQLFEVWTWNQPDLRGDFDEEQDRSPRSFGPLGR